MQSKPTCLEDNDKPQERRVRHMEPSIIRAQPNDKKRGGLDLNHLAALSTGELTRHCIEEQKQYHQGLPVDGHVGLELFRRAIQQSDALAWALIYQQWKPLLLHWLYAHPWANLVLACDSPESYITATLGRFWQATRRTQQLQMDFATLAEILTYVRRCLNSVVLDAVRQVQMRQLEEPEASAANLAASQYPEASAGELWRCIERALPDRRERRLIYLRYVQGYQPREVVAAYPKEFPKVEKIYKMERNILQRLSRHPAISCWKRED